MKLFKTSQACPGLSNKINHKWIHLQAKAQNPSQNGDPGALYHIMKISHQFHLECAYWRQEDRIIYFVVTLAATRI